MEPTRTRSRRRGPRWIELSAALAAVVVSAASLYIARQQTNLMHRQLSASIWPAIQFSTSNLMGGREVITMSIENVGIGPARIDRFSLSHEGRAVEDLTEFITRCCAPEGASVRTVTSFVEGRILPAGETIDFLSVPGDLNHPDVYTRFNRVRGELDFHLCYCSVLQECWSTSRSAREPEPVRGCSER